MYNACSPNHILSKIRSVTQYIAQHHDCTHLAASVLHELCDPACFPLQRVAYFIDNPDFDRLQGVAGIDASHRIHHSSIWQEQEAFAQYLERHTFHQNVRSITWGSAHKRNQKIPEAIEEMAQIIAVSEPSWHIFPAKHGNTGILIFQPHQTLDIMNDYIAIGSSLLGLCPIV